MANQLTLTALLEYADNDGGEISLDVSEKLIALSTNPPKFLSGRQSIGTSEEAIVLGEVTAPAWALFINRDASNYIEIKTATSGTIFAKLFPGEFCFLRLGSGAQAPFAIANTGACILQYVLCLT